MNEESRKDIAARVKLCRKDWYAIIEQIKDSLCELKFKGIHFTHMDINFQISATDIGNTAGVTVSFWNSALDTTDNDKQSHHFIFTGSEEALFNIFDRVESWKEDLVRDHSELLKQQQGELFKS